MPEMHATERLHRTYVPPYLLGVPAMRQVLDGEPSVGGTLAVKHRIGELGMYIKGLEGMAQQVGSYKALLSGESSFSHLLKGQGHIPARRVLHGMGTLDDSNLTPFGAALAGPNYARLGEQRPNERYKFYSSLDLTTPDKVSVGTQWFTEVAQRAHEQGLSLTTKVFDHAYDSLNLYTWQPKALAGILRDLYPKYRGLGMYHATPHFLQGEVEGVDPSHIGYVQEPVSGYTGSKDSHSTRMRLLGATLDARLHGQHRQLSPEIFVEAARAAGVNPAQPYLLAQ